MRFPEPFLWHVFLHLAEACLKFEHGPFKSVTSSKFGDSLKDGYLLHADLKTDNGESGSSAPRGPRLTDL